MTLKSINETKSLLQEIIRILPGRIHYFVFLQLLFQVVLTLLDLSAIGLLGLVTSIGINNLKSGDTQLPSLIRELPFLSELDFNTQFVALSCIAIALFLARTILGLIGNWVLLQYLGNQTFLASKKFVSRIFETGYTFLGQTKSQEVIYSVTTGIDGIILTYFASAILVLSEIIFLGFVSGFIIFINPIAGVTALSLFLIAGIVVNFITANKSTKSALRNSVISIKYNSQILDSIAVFRELFLKGKVEEALEGSNVLRRESLKIRANLVFITFFSKYFFELVMILGAVGISAIQIQFKSIEETIASIVLFLVAASRVLPSIIRMQGALLAMKQSEGASKITLEHLKALPSLSTDRKSLKGDQSLPPKFRPSVEVVNISFSYPNASQKALKNINFSISPGQLVAIVGKSGSGKTTLAHLILGFLKPTSGAVYVSGVSNEDAVKIWPGLISYVPQDLKIIDGSIKKNMQLTEEANVIKDEKFYGTLDQAHLLNEVLDMPLRLEEQVGENGSRLSGGQKQRLGIARALITDPKLILMDESTSSLDLLTEKLVSNKLYRSASNPTIVVIAHRLSTVRDADKVILLEEGEIAAIGTFDEVRKISPNFDEQAKLIDS